MWKNVINENLSSFFSIETLVGLKIIIGTARMRTRFRQSCIVWSCKAALLTELFRRLWQTSLIVTFHKHAFIDILTKKVKYITKSMLVIMYTLLYLESELDCSSSCQTSLPENGHLYTDIPRLPTLRDHGADGSALVFGVGGTGFESRSSQFRYFVL